MKRFSFSRFFSQMWNHGKKKSRKARQKVSAMKRVRLGLESLEDRAVPSITTTLPAPLVSNNAYFSGGFDPQIAIDPLNHQLMAAVWVVQGNGTTALDGSYTLDGGQTWNPFVPAFSVIDPTTETTNNVKFFQKVLDPSITFDRNQQLYIIDTQENTNNTSGAIDLQKWDFSAVTSTSLSGPTAVNLSSPTGNDGGTLALYRWTTQDPATHPVVATDINMASYTDPITGGAESDSMANTGVSLVTTLAASMLAADTSLTVLSSANAPATPFIIQIDSEQMMVTAVDTTSNTWTVARGINGTTAASHNLGANVGVQILESSSNSIATLSGAMLAADTTLTVLPGATPPATPFVIQIDSEQMMVTSVDTTSNTWTVTRGVNGTMAAPHNAGTSILEVSNTNKAVPKAVYVAFNVDYTQPNKQKGPTTVSHIAVEASADGGHTFTNLTDLPDYSVNGNQPAGVDETQPQIVFTPGTSTSATGYSVVGGQLMFFFNVPGGIVMTSDPSSTPPDGGVATAPAAVAQNFAFQGGFVGFDSTNNVITNNSFTGTVNLTAPNFVLPANQATGITDINDLNVTVDLTAPDLQHIELLLMPPSTSTLKPIKLFNQALDASGNSTHDGLPNGGMLLGNTVAPNGNNPGGGPAGTVFDPYAVRSIVDPTASSPYVGHFRPEGDLTEVNGANLSDINGTWTLEVLDNNKYTKAPTEFLSDWSMNFSGIASTTGFGTNSSVVGFETENQALLNRTGNVLLLSGNISATQTTIPVSPISLKYPLTAQTGPFVILVGTEAMLVTNDSGSNWTVVRGVNGTTAAAAGAGTLVYFGDSAPVVGSWNDTAVYVTQATGPAGVLPGLVTAVDNSLGGESPYQDRIYLGFTSIGSGNNAGGTAASFLYGDYGLNPLTGVPGWNWSTPVNLDSETPTDNFSEGNRPAMMPALTVDPTTGSVAATFYDGRNDPSLGRLASSVVISNDGGQTFSPNSYLNRIETATNFLNGNTVTVGPVPSNGQQTGTYGFGQYQGLAAYGGNIYPLFVSNLNSGNNTTAIYTATVTTAAGPRVVYGDQGPVTADFEDPLGLISYNNTFASDGTRRLDGFVVAFDRPVEISSFTAGNVQVQYQNPSTGAITPIPLDSTTPITAVDSGPYGIQQVGAGTAATEFYIKLASPQTAAGTYSYAIGPTVRDTIRNVTSLVSSIGATDSTLTVSNNIGSGTVGPFVIQIDSEQMLVTGAFGTSNWTIVQRGYNNTTAAPHAANAVISTLGNMMDQNTNALTGETTQFATQATTTLLGISYLTGSTADVEVSSSVGFPSVAPFVIQIDSEQMLVTNVISSLFLTEWTVIRGYNGTANPYDKFPSTTLTEHLAGATINSVNEPDVFSSPSAQPLDGVAPVKGVPFQAPYDPSTLPLIIPGPHVVSTSVPTSGTLFYAPSISTTLSVDVLSTDTTITPTSTAGFPTTGAFVVQIGFEQIQVVSQTTALGTTTWTVNRGFDGTPVSAHPAGESITYNPQNIVVNGTENALDITFDRDIAAGTFTAADILSITGPAGPVTGTFTVTADPVGTPAALAHRVFRIGFPTQTLSGSYNVVISPGAITDTNGNGIDNNLNAGLDVLRGAVSDPSTAVIVRQTYTGPTKPIPASGSVSSTISVAQAYQILQAASQYQFSGQTTTIAQSGGIGVSDTTMTVSSSFGFPSSPSVTNPFIVKIDAEEIAVTNVTGTNWTIERGFNGTTPTSHAQNATITLGLRETVQVGLTVSFPDLRNLTATLTSPTGVVVQLFAAITSSGLNHNNINQVIFDDSATAPIQNAQAPVGPGTFNPQTPLSAFNGLGSEGNWTLTITNSGKYGNGSYTGTINSWQLTLPHAEPDSGLGEPIADQFTGSFSIFTQAATNPQSSTQWTEVGPVADPTGVVPNTTSTSTTGLATTNLTAAAGAVTAIAVDKVDPSGNTVYAGGANGGIWKTNDFLTTNPNGPSWVPLTDFGPAGSLRISGITLVDRDNDPSKTIVLAVTGTGPKTVNQNGTPGANDTSTVGGPGVGMLRSTDAGKTWEVLDSSKNVDASGNILPLISPNRDHLFDGTIGFQIVSDPTPLPAGSLDAGNIAVYVALSGANGGVYRSLDDGNTWTLVRAGNATSVVLAPTSHDVNGNLSLMYAGFAGDGVYVAVGDATTATSMAQLTGGMISTPRVDDDTPSLGAYEIATAAPASTPNNTMANPIGQVILAAPSPTGSPLADTFYQGWLYAAVANQNGTFDALYVTKDGGDNWTQVQLPLWQEVPGVFQAYPTNDDPVKGVYNTNTRSYTPGANTLNLAINGQYQQGLANYSLTLAVDPTNPNIAYLGGSAIGTDLPVNGSIRIDITQMDDPYALVGHSNNENDGGLVYGNSVGDTNTKQPGELPYLLDLYNTTAFYTNYLNVYRVPGEPFVAPSSLQFENIPSNQAGTAIGFNNTGTDVSWMPFNDALQYSTDLLAVVAIPDPTTGGTRVIFGDDQGIYSQVADSTGKTLANEGTLTLPTGSRNGNLQIAQLYNGTVQPSTTAATASGSLFYAQAFDGGAPGSSSSILSTGNLSWTGLGIPAQLGGTIVGPVDGNALGTGQVTQAGGIATDPTGSGQTYQFVYPSSTTYPQFVPTDFFQVTQPNQLPASRVSGLVQSTSPSGFSDIPGLNQGQWPEFQGSTFAVNQFDPTGIVMGSQEGRVFLTYGSTTGTGVRWTQIADSTTLDGTAIQAVAFGAPANPGSGTPDNLVYVGTQGGNVYVTFNGGSSWNKISGGLDGTPIEQIVANPSFGSHEAYAVTAEGIYWISNSGATSSTTLNGAISSTATTLTVNSVTGFPNAPFVIQVDTEQMQVTAINGTTWTVSRGFNGTRAASHANLASVTSQITSPWVPLDLTASTTLAKAALATDNTLTVNSTAGFSASVPFVINVDSEQMLVTNVSGTTWSVVRGYNGTTAAAHALNAAVDQRALFNQTRPSFNNATTINQAGGLSATATTMTVTSDAGFPSAPFTAMIGSEKINVTSVAGNVWTIVRGVNNTVAAAHANGATVTDQDPTFSVHYLTSIQADWRYAISTGNSSLITTTLSSAASPLATTINVAASTSFPATPFTARVGTELMQVTNVSGTTWTVTRGFDGTTPVAQPAGATVTLLTVPVLYVGASGGVFRSINQGQTWNFFPNVAGDPTGDGYLPNTDVTSLSLSLGNINPSTGYYDPSSGLNMLVATTFGRGAYAIRLNNSDVAKYLAVPDSGPVVTASAPLVVNNGRDLSGFKVTFGGSVDPSTFMNSDATVKGPGGVVAITSVVDISGNAEHNVYDINFTTPQATTGSYTLTVGPYVYDFSGNPMNQNHNGINGENPGDAYVTVYNFTANTPPTITGIANQVVQPGTSTSALTFTVGSQLTPAASLVVTSTSSNTAIIPSADVVLGGSGSNRTVTVSAPSGVYGNSLITLTVTDNFGLQTTTSFTVNVDTPPTLPAITNPIAVKHGTAVPTYALNAVDNNPSGSLSYSTTLLDPLFTLKNKYAFTSLDGVYNYEGMSEKYLLSNNNSNPAGGNYYILMPGGNIYAFDGKSVATTITHTPIATVSNAVYANPALLTSNTGQPIVTTGANPLYNLKIELGLVNPIISGATNLRGVNEKYLKSTNGSNPAGQGYFVLMPNDQLLAWGGSIASSVLVADLTPYGNVYQNPALLTGATLPTAVGVSAVASATPASGSLQLTALPGFDRSVLVTVTASDGVLSTAQSFTFTVTDTAPSFATVGNQTTPHNATISPFNLNANDAESDPLTYGSTVAGYSPLYNTEVTYGLTSPDIASAYNLRGMNEKYLRSNNANNAANSGYYVLMPTDKLYTWTGDITSTLAASPVIDFTPYGNVYADPALLYKAAFPAAPTVAANRGVLYNIREQFGLSSPDIGFNLRGGNEKYFLSSNGSNSANGGYYVLMPNGLLYAWDNVSLAATLATPPVADLSSLGVYANTALLYNAQPTTITDPIYNVKETYGLNTADITSAFNLRGQNEKYLKSGNGSNAANGGYYVLTSSDKLYAWDGISYATTVAKTPIFDFSSYAPVYANPALLYASTGQVAAVNAAISSAGQITLTQNPNYVGTAQIAASVSDGVETTTQTFLFASTDTAPAVPALGNVSAPHNTTVMPISINATDVESDTLSYLVNVSGDSPLYDVKTQYGLNNADLSNAYNLRHQNEKYFLSTNGSNGAGSGYYVLMPSNKLYAFVPDTNNDLTATLAGTPVADFTNLGAVYSNTALLYNAVAPAASPTVATDRGPFYDVKLQYGLTSPDITSAFNFRGAEEKYFQSTNGSNSVNGGYYVLLPNNKLYAWDGNSIATTTAQAPVADFSNDLVYAGQAVPYGVYSDTSLLFNAQPVFTAGGLQVPAVVATVSNAGTIMLTPNPAFVGTVRVNVAVSDGILVTDKSFLFTVTGGAPVLPLIGPVSVSTTAGSKQINLNTTDYAGHTTDLSFQASIAGYSQLYSLKTQYGLNTAPVGFNLRGQNEIYFKSSNGSNPAGSFYYVLTTGNQLYAFDGNSLATTETSANLIADLSAFNVYANAAQLYNASAPAAPSIVTGFTNTTSGGTLTLTWPSSYQGSFLATVYIGDGADETQQTFLVTVGP